MKKKFWFWVVIILVVVVLSVIVWQTKILQRINQTWQERQFLSKVENIKNTWRNDTAGGATPEETLKMFITAFKAGDLELASKYFVVDKQVEFLAKMQNWVKLGKGEEIIKSLENSKMLGTLREDSFVAGMGEVNNDGKIIHDIEFFRNEFSKKWKISNM
ncbi:MAG: hypothetical protein WC385_03265 [Candidatus Paceibacterota bacterium]|jgi:hypothetical protein